MEVNNKIFLICNKLFWAIPNNIANNLKIFGNVENEAICNVFWGEIVAYVMCSTFWEHSSMLYGVSFLSLFLSTPFFYFLRIREWREDQLEPRHQRFTASLLYLLASGTFLCLIPASPFLSSALCEY